MCDRDDAETFCQINGIALLAYWKAGWGYEEKGKTKVLEGGFLDRAAGFFELCLLCGLVLLEQISDRAGI